MKRITAVIHPAKLVAVKQALVRAGVQGITIGRVSGRYGQGGTLQRYRGSPYLIEFHDRVRIDLAVDDAAIDVTVAAIVAAARTGEINDGEIFVEPLERVVHIRTGERVDQASTLTDPAWDATTSRQARG